MPVIESLSQRIIALCKEKDVQYSASIITNGYLLTKEVAEKLKEYHVRSAQIHCGWDRKKSMTPRRPDGKRAGDIRRDHGASGGDQRHSGPLTFASTLHYDNGRGGRPGCGNIERKRSAAKRTSLSGPGHNQNDVYEPEKCLSNEQYSKINLDFLLRQQIPLGSMYPMPKKKRLYSRFL